MPVILSWNVAGRVRGVTEQAAALAERPADVIALQEIRASARAAWVEALAALGLPHIVASDPPGTAADRRLGVLIAAREPLEPVPSPALPWPERHAAAVVAGGIELHGLHAPISSKREQVKVRTLEAMYEHLAAPSERPRVLVGDLNTPQYESREGEVQTFARTRSGKIRPQFGERHDAAELALIVGLREHGYVDAFRALHGYLRRDRSWAYPTIPKAGYRLDHVICRGVEIHECDYVHEWRERRLSDHSAIWARVS